MNRLPAVNFNSNITTNLLCRDPIPGNDSQLFQFTSIAVLPVSGETTSINVSCTVQLQEPAALITLGISGIMCVCVAIII